MDGAYMTCPYCKGIVAYNPYPGRLRLGIPIVIAYMSFELLMLSGLIPMSLLLPIYLGVSIAYAVWIEWRYGKVLKNWPRYKTCGAMPAEPTESGSN
jgi:hypothetical protein